MQNYFPKEMCDFFLSELDLNVLGYYYLKSYEDKNISLSQYDSNSYNIVGSIKKLMLKNLIGVESPKMILSITPFGKTIAEIIERNGFTSFDINNLDFIDTFDLYFKYFNGKYFYGSCEPDINRYVYSILTQDRTLLTYGNILKAGDRYAISDKDKITQPLGRHPIPECFCDYISLKIPKRIKGTSDVEYFTYSISLNKVLELFPDDYFVTEKIESTDPDYLEQKNIYLEKKKYYEENKSNLEMIKALTNNNIDTIKEPTFDFIIYKYLKPIGEGKVLGDRLKLYKGFMIPYRQR